MFLGPNKAFSPRILQICNYVLCEPLYHLFIMLLKYAIIPEAWKMHKVVPVFEAGDISSVKGYNPISLLSNISKVLECLICNKITEHVCQTIIISWARFNVILCKIIFVSQIKLYQPVLGYWWSQEVLRSVRVKKSFLWNWNNMEW